MSGLDGDGRLFVLDRDELEACVSKGVIGQKELAWIEEQEKRIQANLRRMIADLERLCSTCPTVV